MSYILSLQLDPASQEHFNHLRQQHFPSDRNYIDAHVTLFHNLPEKGYVLEELASASTLASFPIDVTGLRSLGKGLAYTLESSALLALHSRLAVAFADDLIPQDRQRFKPHIVVQNKVTAEAAKLLLQQLQATFTSCQIEATGLSLWRYRNGPWESAQTFPFS
ncbi:2'-5' RNA ligase family protein [Granulicella arctica]|uniref:2'-5' RNA ligase family protein n=1 Tax=Granulicella arctica TaxID=940613 RepID=UPI0021E05C64|nr:2'-5' RNA ligase family protein [Granulicella arctica]